MHFLVLKMGEINPVSPQIRVGKLKALKNPILQWNYLLIHPTSDGKEHSGVGN